MSGELFDILLILLVPAALFVYELRKHYFINYRGSKSYRVKLISIYLAVYLFVAAIALNRIVENRVDRFELRQQIQALREYVIIR